MNKAFSYIRLYERGMLNTLDSGELDHASHVITTRLAELEGVALTRPEMYAKEGFSEERRVWSNILDGVKEIIQERNNRLSA